jgi:hypothetical protein
MDSLHTDNKRWSLNVTNYDEYEYDGLLVSELRRLILEECAREFSGMFIGREDCAGRLGVFFFWDDAYVAYEDCDKQQWQCSYDLDALKRPGWEEYVRLTPDDTHDYSFRRCSIIPKKRALEIVDRYLSTGELKGLYGSGSDGRPTL